MQLFSHYKRTMAAEKIVTNHKKLSKQEYTYFKESFFSVSGKIIRKTRYYSAMVIKAINTLVTHSAMLTVLQNLHNTVLQNPAMSSKFKRQTTYAIIYKISEMLKILIH